MKKIIAISILIISSFLFQAYGQSRGVKYGYTGVTDVSTALPPFFDLDNNSTIFEIANDNVIVNTPFLKIGNSYYSLLTRFDSYLCLVGSKIIPLPAAQAYPYERALLHGSSKADGGFALVSRPGISTSPFVVRNYDNQGNLIFSKAISATLDPNEILIPGISKIIANPDNNNLYLIFGTELMEPGHSGWAQIINFVEISPIGNIVNAFRIKLLDDAIYTDGPNSLYHNFWMGISDAKYVKGSNGPSSDRIWISASVSYLFSYELDLLTYYPNVGIIGTTMASYFPQGGTSGYSGVVVVDPQGTTGELNMLLNQHHYGTSKLAIAKNATATLPAEMMLIDADDNYQPKIFHFMDHMSAIPVSQYDIPYSFPLVYQNLNTDIKKHQNAVLFAEGKYFGTLDPGTLKINLRQQEISNDPVLGIVNFLKGNTNKLYINYKNLSGAPNNLPSNYIVKEDMLYFNSTCKSKFVANLTANKTTPVTYPLVTQMEPLTGITVSNEPYFEKNTKEIITFKNICLNCSGITARNNTELQEPENTETEDLIIYPNPSTSYFALNKTLSIKKVEIYSMTGQLVKSFIKQKQYAINDLAKGSYLVKINTSNGVLRKTLIVE